MISIIDNPKRPLIIVGAQYIANYFANVTFKVLNAF